MKKSGYTFEVYVYGTADSSRAILRLSISPASTGTMSVTVTAPNRYPYEEAARCFMASDGTVFINEEFVGSAISHLTILLSRMQTSRDRHATVTLDTSIGGDGELVTLMRDGHFNRNFRRLSADHIVVCQPGDGALEVYDGDTLPSTILMQMTAKAA